MAVDSKSKRFSLMNLCRTIGALIPSPDGTISSGDRQHFAFCYSGIAFATPTPVIYFETLPRAYYFETLPLAYYFETD
jgi:hypothetical protein